MNDAVKLSCEDMSVRKLDDDVRPPERKSVTLVDDFRSALQRGAFDHAISSIGNEPTIPHGSSL